MSLSCWQDLFPYKNNTFELPYLKPHKLHYVDEGQGEVLLCLHGNPTWSFYYRNIIASFRSKMRVLALDHLGCGLSSKPEDFDYTLSKHIDHLEAFIDHLKVERVNLLVHDWGGAIGLGWAIRHPEKVKSIIFTNTAAFTSKDIPFRIALCKIPVLGEFLIRGFNAFARAALYMAPKKSLNKYVKEGLLFPYDSYRNRVALAKFVLDIPLDEKHVSYQTLKEIEQRLPSLKCPKLFLWGMQDFCFHSGFLDRWKRIYPSAQFKEFQSSGHYLLEDESLAVVNAMEGFLKNHEYRGAH